VCCFLSHICPELICFRKHVFDDLQPYICSYSDCDNGINAFTSQRAWMDHEFINHRIDRQWPCTQCHEIFHQAEDFRGHLQQVHAELFNPAQVDHVINAASRISIQAVEKQQCPFCQTVVSNTKRRFQAHVGKHMQHIALAALPPSEDSNSDDASLQTDQSQGSESDELSDIPREATTLHDELLPEIPNEMVFTSNNRNIFAFPPLQ
jgi:uncharacterized C2H2 Zn-finger protein